MRATRKQTHQETMQNKKVHNSQVLYPPKISNQKNMKWFFIIWIALAIFGMATSPNSFSLAFYLCLLIFGLICWGIAYAVGKVVDATIEGLKCIIVGIIDLFAIEKEVKAQVPEAFKILIQEKKKKAVTVGIFDERSTRLNQMLITSEDGVSDDIIVGKEYIIR